MSKPVAHLSRAARALATLALLAAGMLPQAAAAATPAAAPSAPAVVTATMPAADLTAAVAVVDDPLTVYPSGYRIDPGLLRYVQTHGGVQTLGLPISNAFTLLGSRVQLFERQAVEMKRDGTVDTLNLADGSYFPLARLGGASLAPDPDLLSKLPPLTGADALQRASAYVDATAPNDWNGLPVQFGAAFRASVHCDPCDDKTRFNLALELWGLPIGRPTADPRSADYVYLWFQRGVLVYSRAAHDAQWLLVGETFKRVLQGGDLPIDMVTQISATPDYSRYYGQYDPLAVNSLARPTELPVSSLAAAFNAPTAGGPSTAPTGTSTAAAGPAASTTNAAGVGATAAPKTPSAAPPGSLDPHFGIAEGFRAPDVMSEVKAGWERVVIPWDQVQPYGPTDFSHLGLTLSADRLRADVGRGVRVAGVLQFTPTWAQANTAAGQRSVPKNLNLAFDDPANYWGRFVAETVKHYAGQIDEWIIWNEPEFRPSDTGAGGAYNWAGSDEEFAQLLKVAYQAAKKANPAAVVSFPATSYWIEELSQPKRVPFYARELAILSRDPQAVDQNYYHDAVALNLYRSPDDVYRVARQFTDLQRSYNLDKPLWLTEMNAMATDDAPSQCAARDANSSFKTTLAQQAAYVIQTFALAAAAGYQRAEFYKMVDGDPCREPAWGMLRGDGTRRPVVDSAKVAVSYFSNFTSARFVPLVRPQEAWPAWPSNPASYLPNWQVYQVAFDRPGNQRVTAVWNGDGTAHSLRIPKNGTSAKLIDPTGAQRTLREDAGGWIVDIPAAGAQDWLEDQSRDPDGYHVIGGDPQVLVEEGVDPATPVVPPRLSA